ARSWVPSLWRTCGGLTAPVHGVRSQFLASRSGNWLTSGLFLAPTAQCSLELRSWFLRPFALPVFRRASSLLRPLLTSPALSRRRSPRVRTSTFIPRRLALPNVSSMGSDFAFARTLGAHVWPR